MSEIPFDELVPIEWEPPEESEQAELIRFVVDKKVVGVRFGTSEGFDLLFDDGSELELYALPMDVACEEEVALFWTTVTPEEEEEDAAEEQSWGEGGDDTAMADDDYKNWLARKDGLPPDYGGESLP